MAGEGGILARTARGAGWVVAWRMTTRLLGLASTLVLVRLLAPEDFGLIALASTFALALDACLALGVEDQIVRARDPSRALYDTAFTLNLLRALLVGALVAAGAAPAASFFGDARLEDVLLAYAALTAASGLSSVGVADFRREILFDKEFRLMIAPRIASIVVTVAAAFLLDSHWALVAGGAVNRLGKIAMGYAMHPYRPRLSLGAWRDLAGVSAWTWALSVAYVARERADTIAVGRLLGPTEVGVYAVGAEMATLTTTELVDPICRACMPAFAAADRTGAGAAEAYLRITGLTALLALPAGAGVSLVAGPVVALGFGQAWLGAAPLIAVIGAASAFALFGNVSAAVLGARALLGSLLWIVLSAAALRIALLLALIAWLGLFGAAVAVALCMVVEHTALVARALRALGLRPAAFMASIWRPALAASAMALVLWWAGFGWAPPPGSAERAARALALSLPLGAAVYVGALGALWFASGRPAAAAEADMLTLLRRGAGFWPSARAEWWRRRRVGESGGALPAQERPHRTSAPPVL